jgi:hypothetical protein
MQRRQFVEFLPHRYRFFSAEELILRVGTTVRHSLHDPCRIFLGGFLFFPLPCSLSFAKNLQSFIHQNPGQPGPKRCLAPKIAQLAVRQEQTILDGVLRLFALANDAMGHAQEEWTVACKQEIERFAITKQSVFNQFDIRAAVVLFASLFYSFSRQSFLPWGLVLKFFDKFCSTQDVRRIASRLRSSAGFTPFVK